MKPLESPAQLIYKLAHALALEMERRLRVYDVTLSQWSILKQLWRQEGRSQVELQRLVGLERATVNGLVQRMARSDLIQFRADPVDKRVQRIFLTERGKGLQSVTTSLEEEVNALVLEGFSNDERIFFVSLLGRAFHNATKT